MPVECAVAGSGESEVEGTDHQSDQHKDLGHEHPLQAHSASGTHGTRFVRNGPCVAGHTVVTDCSGLLRTGPHSGPTPRAESPGQRLCTGQGRTRLDAPPGTFNPKVRGSRPRRPTGQKSRGWVLEPWDSLCDTADEILKPNAPEALDVGLNEASWRAD